MSAPVTDANPPRGHFSVWQRLFRGYGPLAVFALMILLLSVLVPSKVHDDADAASLTATPRQTAAGGAVAVGHRGLRDRRHRCADGGTSR